jgi:hypothetical protein
MDLYLNVRGIKGLYMYNIYCICTIFIHCNCNIGLVSNGFDPCELYPILQWRRGLEIIIRLNSGSARSEANRDGLGSVSTSLKPEHSSLGSMHNKPWLWGPKARRKQKPRFGELNSH